MNDCDTCFYAERRGSEEPCKSCYFENAEPKNWVSIDFLKDIPGTDEEDEAFGVIANMAAQLMAEKVPEDVDSLAAYLLRRGPIKQVFKEAPSALNTQVGGGHYKGMAIQPVKFLHANKIPFLEGSAIKYLCRWRDKGGIKDLEKAKHFIELLIELEGKQK
jgi:hypothetical protein